MALFQTGYFSSALGRQTSFNAVFPDNVIAENKKFPVMYLLHGLSDDYSIWLRRSSIERYAATYKVAVIMPDGGKCFYTDMKHGDACYTAIAEELPAFVSRMFPVSTERKDTFIAGLSMGGYGALKIALRNPEKFAAAGIMSAVTDITEKFASATFDMRLWQDIFGSAEDVAPDGNDLFELAEKVRNSGQCPRIAHFCGDKDFLLADNRKLRDALEKMQWPDYLYREAPGVHSWEFWDKHIQDILQFFFKGENHNG